MRRLLPLPLCCLLLGACSSVSVIEEREDAALAPKSAPRELLVRPFGISPGARFQVAPASEKENPRERVGRIIAEGVLSRGVRWVAPTRVLEPGEKVPPDGLLIEGGVLLAEQGSRALRLGVGFGAGRTRLDTTVRVYNLAASAAKPWLTCKTTGGSNMEPGILFGLIIPSPATIPVLLGVAGGTASAFSKSNKGITQDGKRTGRAITGVVHDRLAARGLVPRKAWPKRGGSLGTPAGVIKLPEI
ncbi:MAG: DUF4410 domain-containing protein [Chthoniobacterales bacterium]